MGFPGNDYYLLRDEPGYQGAEFFGEASDGCSVCDGEGDSAGECWNCDPSCSLEYTPVRASFLIVDGVVSEVAL